MTDYWREQAKLAAARPGRSGSEKRRARKGGAFRGPGNRGRFRQSVRSRHGLLAPYYDYEAALTLRGRR